VPAIDEQLTNQLLEIMPFARALGVQFVVADPGSVRGIVEWDPSRCTSGGILHGGVLMAMADTLGAACAFANLPEDAAGTTTIESKTNFFRAVRDGYVDGTARPLHVGRTTIVVDTELRDANAKLVARVTQTQAVLR